MGKRELVLILIFALAGAGAWHLSAPASPADQAPFSFARVAQRMRARFGGNRVTAQVKKTAELPAPPALVTVIIRDAPVDITVVGEDRTTVAAELEATVAGPDDEAARARGRSVVLSLRADQDRAVVDVEVPGRNMRREPARVTLRVPGRLAVEAPGLTGALEASDVARLRVDGARAQVRARRVTGTVTVSLLAGDVDVDGAHDVHTDTRRADVRLARVTGDATLTAVDGRLTVHDVRGRVQIDSTRADIDMESSGTSPLRVTAKDARADITWPAAHGATLDVSVEDGSLTVPEGVRVETTDRRQRATGALGSGGPVVAIEATRGSVSIARAAGPS